MDHILVLHRFGIGSRAPTMRSQGWKPLFYPFLPALAALFLHCSPMVTLTSLPALESSTYLKLSCTLEEEEDAVPKVSTCQVLCTLLYCDCLFIGVCQCRRYTELRSSITLWGRQIPELKNKNSKLQTAVDRRYWICRLANRRVMSVRQIFVGRHVAQNKERRRHIEPTNTVVDYSMSLFTPTDMSACRSTLGRYIDWHVPDVLCLTTKFVDCEQPVWSDLTEILYKDSEGKYDI